MKWRSAYNIIILEYKPNYKKIAKFANKMMNHCRKVVQTNDFFSYLGFLFLDTVKGIVKYRSTFRS